MAVYVICYDLRKPDYDYQPVYDELNSLSAKHISRRPKPATEAAFPRISFQYER